MDVRARAILREQYEAEVSFNKAMNQVVADLGPDIMDEQEALYWWDRFQRNNFDISYRASRADRALLKNGTLLRAFRAEVDEISGDWQSYIMCKMTGAVDRFYILCYRSHHVVVDMLHGTYYRELFFDWSMISRTEIGLEEQEYFALVHIHFVNDTHILGVLTSLDRSVFWLFSGTLDIPNSVVKFEKAVQFNGESHHFITDSTAKDQSILWRPADSETLTYATIDFNDGSLAIKDQIVLPFDISFPMKHNGILYGFSVGEQERVNVHQLIEFSLTNGTSTIIPIQVENGMSVEISKWSPYGCSENKLWVAPYNSTAITTKLVQLDLSTLKWMESSFEVKSEATQLFVAEDTVIVHSFTEELMVGFINTVYRFPIGCCDSLSRCVWNYIRRQSQIRPQFHHWFVSKLPAHFRSRYPSWE